MLKYRRDIDGLRAIAVSLVILFHYQFPFFTGGFIGVDVFFVISGFLITGLLLNSMRAGKFSYAGFYARRIRRLLPAFLFVSLVTFLVISRYYMDDDYYVFSKSWLGSVVGLSNFYYLGELSQYFSADAKVISLLHTWSLAVEEQFYIFWPILLLLISPYLLRPTFLPVFIVCWIAAFALSIWYAVYDPQAAYFLLPARIFELMLGGGLALFSERLPRLGAVKAEFLSVLGLLMIVLSALLLTERSIFPGYNALWPTAGAALIIFAGMSSHNGLVKRMLSSRGFVFIGALSYSLYLWHWPPLALLNYQLIELTMINKLLLVVFSLLAAWFTYRFVENRFRYRNWSFKKTFNWLILLPCFLIWIVQVTIRTNDDLSFRMPEENQALYKILQQQNSGDLFDACFDGDDYRFEQGEACLFGNKTTDGKPNSVLIGDSHATSMIGFLETLVADTNYYFLAVTKASAPFIIEEYASQALAKEKDRQRSKALQVYLSEQPMTVFINIWWSSYLENSNYSRYLMATFEWLLAQGHRVVILEDAPILPSQAHAFCLLKGRTDCAIDRQAVDNGLFKVRAFKSLVQETYPEVLWINPRQAVCDEQVCETVLEGIPLYRDEHHLNHLGSKILGEAYLKQFGNPLE